MKRTASYFFCTIRIWRTSWFDFCQSYFLSCCVIHSSIPYHVQPLRCSQHLLLYERTSTSKEASWDPSYLCIFSQVIVVYKSDLFGPYVFFTSYTHTHVHIIASNPFAHIHTTISSPLRFFSTTTRVIRVEAANAFYGEYQREKGCCQWTFLQIFCCISDCYCYLMGPLLFSLNPHTDAINLGRSCAEVVCDFGAECAQDGPRAGCICNLQCADGDENEVSWRHFIIIVI